MSSKDHQQNQDPKWLAFVLCLAGIGSRLIPHLHNFSAVGAASLFAGARLNRRSAFAVPLLIILITNPLLAYLLDYPAMTIVTLFVCGGFLVNVWIGRRIISATENPLRIGGAALIGSAQFFVITNLGVWLSSGIYPPTGEGLLACYVAGIPFFGRTVLSDLLYTGVFFGIDFLARKWGSRVPASSTTRMR